MTFAYQITQYNGIDYATKTGNWNLVAERKTQKQALATCQHFNKVKPYSHRVEVVKSLELPKFTILKPAKNQYSNIVVPVDFKVIKKRNFLRRLLGVFSND